MGVKILIVDDSATARLQAEQALKGMGFVVIQAEHGDDALKKLAEHPDVKLVISDVTMPWKDGFELLAELRAQPATQGLPVIMVTTEGSAPQIGKARKLGISGYLVKPYKPEHLAAAVKKLVA